MERRDFLKLGVVGGAALSASPALAGADDSWFRLGRIERVLDRMDEAFVSVGRQGRRLREALGPQPGPEAEGLRVALEGAFQSLSVYGLASELPLEAQVHPGVQRRLLDAAERMGDAMGSLVDWLGQRSAEELESARDEVDEARSERWLRRMDREVKALGVSGRMRLQLQRTARQLHFRARSQNPSSLVDEYVDKVRRVQASGASGGLRQEGADDPRIAAYRQAWIDAGVPVSAYHALDAELGELTVQSQVDAGVEPGVEPEDELSPAEQDRIDSKDKARRVLLVVFGLILLGIGIAGAVGFLAITIGDPAWLLCICVSVPVLLLVLGCLGGGLWMVLVGLKKEEQVPVP